MPTENRAVLCLAPLQKMRAGAPRNAIVGNRATPPSRAPTSRTVARPAANAGRSMRPRIGEGLAELLLRDADETGERDRERVLRNGGEHLRGDERVEHAAEHTARGQPEIELGQVLDAWAIAGQLAMTQHRQHA